MRTKNRPPLNKWWRKSRTLRVNAALAALMALEGVTGWLQPYLPVNFYVAMAVALPIVNAILRAITTQPLCLYNPQEAE